eukprot:TRINITY_DN8421_c0_g1_i1.p1 TRINITY_DN8421_c0_g1~~TRINITY_DN8421_c0_g1_i1.p1  ORF type:complete len:450 (-),score=42.56 TRINITY_DN8421_c0_g1_i1:68-1282(-)
MYHLEVEELGQFMRTSKYNLSLVSRTGEFWINLAQEKYWSDLGSLDEEEVQEPDFYKKKFQELHSWKLDTLDPTRITSRYQKIHRFNEGKSKILVDFWYYAGLMPFWDAMFVLSLSGFFVFLPVYLDGFIPGLRLNHVMIFLIIPYLQLVWNMLLSIIPLVWKDFQPEWIERRIPFGSLLPSLIPMFVLQEEDDDRLVSIIVISFIGVTMLWWGLVILTALSIMPYWIVSFCILELILLFPIALIWFKHYDDEYTWFDVIYQSIIVLSLGVWLIFWGIRLDGFISWHWALVFGPLFLSELMVLVLPVFIVASQYCCEGDLTILQVDGVEMLCALSWPFILVISLSQILSLLVVTIDWGYWTCAFIPIFIFNIAFGILWGVLYRESLRDCRRPAYFMSWWRANYA